MCLSLEHQTRRKPLKKWVILMVLQFRYTFYGIWLAVIDFQNGEQQSRSGSDKKRRNRLR